MKTKTRYTKEEKQAYFRGLRERWQAVKASITDDARTQINAVMAERGLNFSVNSWVIIEQQMRAQGLDGLPYVDAKTFHGWRESGFMVRKGEKSTLSGITWIGTGDGDDDGGAHGENGANGDGKKEKFVFPKSYALFHRSQVDAIA
jgi:hypothetical protein